LVIAYEELGRDQDARAGAAAVMRISPQLVLPPPENALLKDVVLNKRYVTPIADEVTAELRELVRVRTRYVDEHSDRMRQLHRAVDLGFPEFTHHIQINTALATAILPRYPTARSFANVAVRKLARQTCEAKNP
jgi:hypothetical protein